VTVRHILVKYAGATRAPAEIKRTRADACLRAQEALKLVTKGDPFEDVVSKYSDEPGAASRAGSLGSIERTDVAAPFADAAFSLGRGGTSTIVETEFGFHIIYRTE